MNIMWLYLDTRHGAERALQDRRRMQKMRRAMRRTALQRTQRPSPLPRRITRTSSMRALSTAWRREKRRS